MLKKLAEFWGFVIFSVIKLYNFIIVFVEVNLLIKKHDCIILYSLFNILVLELRDSKANYIPTFSAFSNNQIKLYHFVNNSLKGALENVTTI